MKSFIKNNILNILAGACLSLFLVSCDEDSVQTLPTRNWELTWSDNFDGNAGILPDATKWTFDIGNNSGWGNQELQYYTKQPQNVALDGNGNLVITALKQSYSGSPYTSARIKTQGLFAQAYGKIEARIKTPYGPGIWPAFWMLGDNVATTPWPKSGEIDIMELKGHQPNIVYGTLHGPGYSGGSAITKAYGLKDSRFDADYHLFSVEWTQDQIDFFVDDYLYQRVKRSDLTNGKEWVYDHPFFIILNVAVGGNFVGFPVDGTPFPQKMYVDYVKVYKAK